jgi:NAD-dependent deacetylase
MMTDLNEDFLDRVRQARRIVFSTGAGISAESGVPTFRGKDGIWSKLRPEELASVDGFLSNPQLVWEWYRYRRELMSAVEPNPGHFAIAGFQKRFPGTLVITQNVDGLHARAGATGILELHGNITKNKCFQCQKPYVGEINIDQELPKCSCGGMIRPDVVWFGEMLPSDVIDAAFQAAGEADLFFSVGTSALVQPAASLPLEALRQGAFVVEVNIEPTALTPSASFFLQGKSGEILPQILTRL